MKLDSLKSQFPQYSYNAVWLLGNFQSHKQSGEDRLKYVSGQLVVGLRRQKTRKGGHFQKHFKVVRLVFMRVVMRKTRLQNDLRKTSGSLMT